MANLFVQVVAIGILFVARHQIADGWSSASLFLRLAILAVLALPVLQIIPLPPDVWQSLPGRDIVESSLALVGAENTWRSFSVDPANTALALSGLIAPVVLLFVALGSEDRNPQPVLYFVIGLTLAVILLGAIQLSTGGAIGSLYHSREPDYLLGTFANHNSTGLFLLIGMCCLIESVFRASASRGQVILYGAIALLLFIAVVLTMSRSSIALLIVPLTLAGFRAWKSGVFQRFGKAAIIGIVVGGLAILAGGLALSSNERVAVSVDRFSVIESTRAELWTDSLASAQRFFPVGSGMGTFDEVIQLDESLETIQPQRAGRAHNDYLELVVEGGLLSVSILFIWLAYIAIRLLGSRHATAVSKPFIAAVSLLYVAQSVLDYPLRSQALLCVAAIMIALIEMGRRTEKGWDNAV